MADYTICRECETVAHCSRHGCIPLTPCSEARHATANDLKTTIREAGGVVHSDGNIFFTNAKQFLAAASAMSPQASSKGGEAVLPQMPDLRYHSEYRRGFANCLSEVKRVRDVDLAAPGAAIAARDPEVWEEGYKAGQHDIEEARAAWQQAADADQMQYKLPTPTPNPYAAREEAPAPQQSFTTAPRPAADVPTADPLDDATIGTVLLVALALDGLKASFEVSAARLNRWREFAKLFVDSVGAAAGDEEDALRLIDAALDSLTARAVPGRAP